VYVIRNVSTNVGGARVTFVAVSWDLGEVVRGAAQTQK